MASDECRVLEALLLVDTEEVIGSIPILPILEAWPFSATLLLFLVMLRMPKAKNS